MKKDRTNKKKRGPSGVGIFISVTFPPCVPFQRMNGALKKNKTESFSLNNLFSCELAAVTQMDSETARAAKTVHNLFLYITKSESGVKKR